MNWLVQAVAAVVLFAATASAQYTSDTQRGLITQKFKSPSGSIEECVVMKPLPLPDTTPNNKAVEKEATLCELDFYSDKVGVVGVCPKLNSTNPGVDLYAIAASVNKATFQQQTCRSAKIVEQKISKFKQSVSCSYTPSILAYYQLSKHLENLNVPAVVIRTMDVGEHKRIRNQAMDILRAAGRTGELIYQTWRSGWNAAYASPQAEAGDRVFTSDTKQIYGAMTVNPKSELKYSEVFGRWSRYEDRHKAITAQVAYQNVVRKESLAALAPAEPTEAGVQAIVQMRDVTDMLILDYILGQWDRPGNIHYVEKLYYSPDGVSWFGIPIANAIKPGDHESAKYKFRIKEMVLKDNDCGIVKGNATKQNRLLQNIAHISPRTYRTVMDLAKNWSSLAGYLKTELLFTDRDVQIVGRDLIEVRDLLRSRCKSGLLKQDLNLRRHFGGEGAVTSCD